jgi:hypothetical protein
MKIVLIVEGVFPEKKGGLERWYKYLSIAFTKQGHSVTYINFSNVDGVRDGVHYKSIQNNVLVAEKIVYRSSLLRSPHSSHIPHMMTTFAIVDGHVIT